MKTNVINCLFVSMCAKQWETRTVSFSRHSLDDTTCIYFEKLHWQISQKYKHKTFEGNIVAFLFESESPPKDKNLKSNWWSHVTFIDIVKTNTATHDETVATDLQWKIIRNWIERRLKYFFWNVQNQVGVHANTIKQWRCRRKQTDRRPTNIHVEIRLARWTTKMEKYVCTQNSSILPNRGKSGICPCKETMLKICTSQSKKLSKTAYICLAFGTIGSWKIHDWTIYSLKLLANRSKPSTEWMFQQEEWKRYTKTLVTYYVVSRTAISTTPTRTSLCRSSKCLFRSETCVHISPSNPIAICIRPATPTETKRLDS